MKDLGKFLAFWTRGWVPVAAVAVIATAYAASWGVLGPVAAILFLPLLVVFWPYVASFLLFSTFEGAGGVELILTIAVGGVVQMIWIGLLGRLFGSLGRGEGRRV